ncbi:MAG: hypothetical protein ABEL97_15985 [Salinibacter sp.]
MRAVGLLLLLWMGYGPTASAQASFPGAPEGPALNLRVYPSDIWGPRVGAGVGVGLVGHGLARPHDLWLLTAAPARYEQVATLSFSSANPRRARRYLIVDGRALHTDRDWLGPPGDRLVLGRSSARARLRLGQTLLGGHLLLQPHLALETHRVDAVRAPSPLPPTLRGAPDAIPRPGATYTGLRGGVGLQLDTRAALTRYATGVRVQATWDRYTALDGSALRFDRFDGAVLGTLALDGLHRLDLRAGATLTRARTAVAVPTVLLPAVGGTLVPGWARGRFVGRDRLFGGLLYRFPLWTFGRVATLEGHLGGHLAATYQRLGREFALRVEVDDAAPIDETVPLRPTASVGLRVAVPSRPHVHLDVALGLSPEGLSAARLSLIQPLQTLRPLHHAADHLGF